MKRNLVSNLLFLAFVTWVLPVMAASPGIPTVKVTGEISRPGVYPYHKGDKASALICQAGITLTSNLSRVQVIRRVRGANTSIEMNAGWIFTTTRVSSSKPTGLKDVELRPGDTINIAVSAPQTISMNLKDVPLVTALESILKDSGVSYWIDPALKNTNLKVTAVLKNVSLESALKTVIGASGISYQMDEGNVLKITPVSPDNSAGNTGRVSNGFSSQIQPRYGTNDRSIGTASTPSIPVVNPDTKNDADRVLEIIVLKYLKAGDAVPIIMNLKGILSVQSSGDSQLVVSGTRDALKQAVEVLSQIDVPDAYPHIIRVIMEVKLTAGDVNQVLKTESVSLEGEQVPLNIAAGFPVDNNTTGTVILEALVRPEYNDSTDPDQITITGSGNINSRTPIITLPNKAPVELRKTFNFVTSVPDTADTSKGSVASSGEIVTNGRTVGFTVTVKAHSEGRASKVSVPRTGAPGAGGFGGMFPGTGRVSDGRAPKSGAPNGGGFGGMSPGAGGARMQEPKK